MAAKRTAELIPLCHPLPLTHVDVELTPDPAGARVLIEGRARSVAATGVEMEALPREIASSPGSPSTTCPRRSTAK